MPELPEVETVRRILEPQLAGRTVEAVEVRNAQIIAHPEAGRFAAQLQGQILASMSRRGKLLTLHFASGDRLSLHLRMTGQLLVMPTGEPEEKHTHLILTLSGTSQLRYLDVRRFGRFWLFKKGEEDALTGQAQLGPEPTDPALTAEYLKAKLGSRKKAIKEMLCDQTVVAGIGNIYSDEILFAAGVYPGAKCDALGDPDWERLARVIPERIAWGIEADAMTSEEYLEKRGKDYRNTPFLRVYGHEGEPCPVCGELLCRMRIGGRSSTYCPVCQKASPAGPQRTSEGAAYTRAFISPSSR